MAVEWTPCVVDLGEAWMEDTALPIPLGLDVFAAVWTMRPWTRRAALKESIQLAHNEEEEAVDYAMRSAAASTARLPQFVRMYVNADTVDMGDEGAAPSHPLHRARETRSPNGLASPNLRSLPRAVVVAQPAVPSVPGSRADYYTTRGRSSVAPAHGPAVHTAGLINPPDIVRLAIFPSKE